MLLFVVIFSMFNNIITTISTHFKVNLQKSFQHYIFVKTLDLLPDNSTPKSIIYEKRV